MIAVSEFLIGVERGSRIGDEEQAIHDAALPLAP
jgi:hypothetical protein